MMAVVSLLTRIRNSIRSTLRTLAFNARRQNAGRILSRRMLSFRHKDIFEGEDMSVHYGDIEILDLGLQKVVMSFIIERINFIEKVLAEDEIAAGTFVDLGDSSGIFLKAFGKRGTSVNIAEEPLENIRAKDIKTVKADIQKLPFDDNSIDHVLLFETLEHLPDPIAGLQEIYRVCRKSLFVSTPYVSRTNIFKYDPEATSYMYQHHVFEFNDDDFRKIVSHTGFKINRAEVVEVLNDGENLKELLLFPLSRLFFDKAQLFGCFKKFALYHLVKN